MQVSQQHIAQTILDQNEPELHPALAAEIVAENYVVLDRAVPDKPEFILRYRESTQSVVANQAEHKIYIDNASIEGYERAARLHLFMHQKALELRAKHDARDQTRLARVLHTTSEASFADCMEQAKELMDMGVKFINFPKIPDTPEI